MEKKGDSEECATTTTMKNGMEITHGGGEKGLRIERRMVQNQRGKQRERGYIHARGSSSSEGAKGRLWIYCSGIEREGCYMRL